MGFDILYNKILIDYYNEFKSIVKDKKELNIKELCNQLQSFALSEHFIPFIYFDKELYKNENLFIFFVKLFKSKEKYLSIKVFLNLLEELKKMKFDEQIKNIYKEIKTEKKSEEFQKQLNLYIEKNKDILSSYSNETNNNLKEIEEFFNENKKFIKKLWTIYYVIFFFTFKNIDDKIKSSIKMNDRLFSLIYSDDTQEMQNIINNLLEINSLNYTNNPKHIVIFILNLIIFGKQIGLREPNADNFFDNFNNKIDTNDEITWLLYEEYSNSSNAGQKYIKTLLGGNMTQKEKYKFDLFDNIYKIKNQYIKGMNGSIFKSLFGNKEIILIIQFDLDYLKQNKLTSAKINEQIDSIKKCTPSQYKILNFYAQLENTIINLDVQYDFFIYEMKNRNIIEGSELNLNHDKEEIKTLKEKIKKLEEELKEKKNKNNNCEKPDKDFEQKLKKNLEKETKESLIDIIIKKEKEIKDLKSKLSKLPESGEKLMTVNFVSANQSLYFSVICKKTDEFFKIEEILGKKYPGYSKGDKNFTFNGIKINRFKTLEKIGIKDNDVIYAN